MKQVFGTNKGVNVFDVALPTCGDNEILVSVEASVISTGTETMGMKGYGSFNEMLEDKIRLAKKVIEIFQDRGLKFTVEALKKKLSPVEQTLALSPMGYSNAGVVIAKGRMVNAFNIGDKVACAGAGIAAHAEYVTIPVNLAVKLPVVVDVKSAAFTTMGAIAMQGLRRTEVGFGETIVISGLGLLGLLAVQIAKAWGLVVIGLDLNEQRLALARELGADYCFNATDPDLVQTVKAITYGNGVDAVVIYAATKSSAPANQAFKFCRRKGRVVVVGAIGMELDREDMYMKELDFVMSTSYGPGRYDKNYETKGIDYPIGYVRWTENRNMQEFVRLLADGKINVDKLISNIYSIDQTVEAYKSLLDNPSGNIANIFIYSADSSEPIVKTIDLYPRPISAGKIKVGIIGAGSFIQENHLANLLKLPDVFELIAIANGTPAGSKSAGEKYKCRYITTDYKELLKDKEIDLIIIGTRHHLHAQQVIDAINAGKHVLVEKPLALTLEEMEAIKKAYNNNSQVHVTVGFNRRYSPLTKKVKQIIQQKNQPVMINCRVNAGYFPPDFWAQTMEEGGGRIIGEACHFVDFITYLAGSEISAIEVFGVPVDGKMIQSQDNVMAIFQFKNGSLANIVYTSLGGKSMEKERIEVFCGKTSMVINDFLELQLFDVNEPNIVLKEKDKGHSQLITELSRLIRGEESLIMPFGHDCTISELTIRMVNQLNGLN